MGKIHCLTSMFVCKTKLKSITSAECAESESVWGSSRKQLSSKDGDSLSQSSQKDFIAKDDSTNSVANDNSSLMTMPAGNTSKKLVSVSSITEWVKQGDVSCRDSPCVEVSQASHAELFEFDTTGVNKMKNDEAHSHDNHISGGMKAAEAFVEEDRNSRSIRTGRHSEGSRSGQLFPDERHSGSSAGDASATYYELHSNMACKSGTAAGHIFDEEGVGDYASDPGVYHDDSCLNPLEKDLEDDQLCHGEDADHFLKKARSEGGLYELGLISQQLTGQSTEQDLAHHSQGSPSYQGISRQDSSIHLPKGLVEGPHSEIDQRDAKDLFLNERSSDKDVDYCNGSSRLEFDAYYPRSDVHNPESIRSGSFLQKDDIAEFDADNVKSHNSAGVDGVPDGCISGHFQDLNLDLVAGHDENDHTKQDARASELDRPNLSRVEEWIRSIEPTPFLADEEVEPTAYSDTEPSAPAASFFRARARPDQMHLDGIALVDRRNHQGEQLIDADSEMASFIARSVNPLCTVAHFSGVGLKLPPPLGAHNNLKTLNLSANAIVRMLPGCLPKSLHTLDLSRNKIVVIEGLRELSRLRVLNLSHNRIIRIGHGLANCTSLREIYLAGNKISEIEGLHRLLKLSFIDLSFNKIASAKSIGQLAANYNSLQAINLLGNPLHSNLGEEPLRKLIVGLTPHVVYLNKQATKAVSARDASVDSVARAALANPSHHTHQRGKTSSQSKSLRRSGAPASSTASSPRHRDKRTGEKSAAGRTNALKSRTPSELPPRHRYSHSRLVHGSGVTKDHPRSAHLPMPPPVQNFIRAEEKV
ncbi:uncharacterized protein [Physcomitrium patens]|uniref:Uncharacterized protein n=2 Tax=Physcomitrium patens TaxID=3218 RepID=A0A7I4CW34_PHYPA|nr:uncharacterized protein LOC112277157 isoform X2 [Physcomitrium patens]|eukprot:XP_024364961.1 uncharacterized protein LOC112277157 isoform X2 [Physcomitrella patens]